MPKGLWCLLLGCVHTGANIPVIPACTFPLFLLVHSHLGRTALCLCAGGGSNASKPAGSLPPERLPLSLPRSVKTIVANTVLRVTLDSLSTFSHVVLMNPTRTVMLALFYR